MTEQQIKEILCCLQSGDIDLEGALEKLRGLPFENIGHTKIDHHRALRNGFPEVIYGAGKTPTQVADIFGAMMKRGNVLATRVSDEAASAVQNICPSVEFNTTARTLVFRYSPVAYREGKVLIATAGTSDLAVAEEARVTSDILGNPTELISDIGVAGIHRMFDSIDKLRDASVIIVVAGMEGALASVVGGVTNRPVIAVPTSVGYGASFQGMAALLGMLTSCAAGVTVVNIDNGFGAACAATRIVSTISSPA